MTTNPTDKPASLVTSMSNFNAGAENVDQDKNAAEELDPLDKDEDPITVVHSPLSADQWHAQLQKAGQQLEKQPKTKKNTKDEDEAQLVSRDTFMGIWDHTNSCVRLLKHGSQQCVNCSLE